MPHISEVDPYLLIDFCKFMGLKNRELADDIFDEACIEMETSERPTTPENHVNDFCRLSKESTEKKNGFSSIKIS
jgi:hypothetical protein